MGNMTGNGLIGMRMEKRDYKERTMMGNKKDYGLIGITMEVNMKGK